MLYSILTMSYYYPHKRRLRDDINGKNSHRYVYFRYHNDDLAPEYCFRIITLVAVISVYLWRQSGSTDTVAANTSHTYQYVNIPMCNSITN